MAERTLQLGPLGAVAGGAVNPNSAIACAIGPNSMTDLVLVNGSLRVGAGQIVPVSGGIRTVAPLRSFRTAAGAAAGSDTSKAPRWCELTIWEECPMPTGMPSPRAPYLATFDGAASAAAGTELVVLPFQGRRNSRWTIMADAAVTWTVFGVRYLPRASALIRSINCPKLSIDTGALAGAANFQSYVQFYVGGTDTEEAWDELVLEVVGAGSNFIAEAEAWGELNSR